MPIKILLVNLYKPLILMYMTMIYCLKFAGVMFSMILADISWTYYFMKVEERSSLSASMWSSLIIIFGMFTTMNYVDDRSLSIAAIIGAFIGTYIAIEMKKRKEKNIVKAVEV